MRSGFDGAPVVARGDDDRVHAIHDAFVVSGGAVGVHCGESVGSDDAIADLFTAEIIERQFFDRDGTTCTRNASICQVGENAQVDLSDSDSFDLWCESFTSRVDRICTHRIADVINEVND